jgi:vitamin B12 transporter
MRISSLDTRILGVTAGVAIGVLTASAAPAEDPFDFPDWGDSRLEPMTVISSRIPGRHSEPGRSVSVLEETEFRISPVRSAIEMLGYADGVDLQARGTRGIQADLSIRGSTFEQTGVLVDGVPVNDPQTGHHKLNLPISVDDVERIEVLRGHGSSLYGSSAFGGVVNFVTRRPNRRRVHAHAFMGENSTRGGSVSYSAPLPRASYLVSAEARSSDGFRDGTDYDVWSVFAKTVVHLPWGDNSLMLAHAEKEFGAYDFYSPGADYPSREWTRTTLASYGTTVRAGAFTIRPRLSYRHHRDKFMLDDTDPAFFLGRHATDVYSAAVHASCPVNNRMKLSMGAELVGEEIDSNSLGDHSVTRSAGMVELGMLPPDGHRALNLGLRFDHYSSFGPQWSPSISGRARVSDTTGLRFSAGRCFRAPTFTERYYDSPANVGDPDLEPEEGWSYEAGVDLLFAGGMVTGGLTAFLRNQENLIDWMRSPSTAPRWTATNITSAQIRGVEIGTAIRPTECSFVSLAYTRVVSEPEMEGNYLSKYALNHPRHYVQGRFGLRIPFGYAASVRAAYKERKHGDIYTLVDVYLEKTLASGDIFLEATNVFDVEYEEIEGVEQPGRWITGGMKVTF